MVIHPDGSVDQLAGVDPLIGAVRRASRANRSLLLEPGTTLLHTDGLVETRPRHSINDLSAHGQHGCVPSFTW